MGRTDLRSRNKRARFLGCWWDRLLYAILGDEWRARSTRADCLPPEDAVILLKNVPFEKRAQFLLDNVCSYPDSSAFAEALGPVTAAGTVA